MTRNAVGPSVDDLVAGTPASRDRVVDLLRVVSIGVVVVWHWSLSVLHWRDGALTMPNPVGDVPGLWAATWVLQVMPLFFLVGGYANLAGWEGVRRDGGGAAAFLRKRVGRLGRPVAVLVLVWAVVDLAWRAGGGRSVLDWGMVVFVPLWFLGVYVGVVALVPVTARLHARHGARVLVVLAAGILAADALRLGPLGGADGAGWAGWAGGAGALAADLLGLAGSALVWVFCHQLGYRWRDGTLVAGGRRAALALVGGGLGALALLTGPGPYPRSMVAVRGEATSNMFPTTACIAALAVLQLGLVLLARPALARWLDRPRNWRAVVAANGVAMTVFCWHMTALVIVVGVVERAGVRLGDEPTASWWMTRPVWVAGPALVLAALMAVVARVELRR